MICRRIVSRGAVLLVATAAMLVNPSDASAQITAQVRSAPTPPWSKGMQPIGRESYYNAKECGKQGGQNPPCVFWDTGICKNPDFQLSFFSAYKRVAYEVWSAVHNKQPAPTPNYADAQKIRVTVGVAPEKGSKNTFTKLVVKRGGKVVTPVAEAPGEGGGKFTYDYPPWAPTDDVTIEMIGKTKTIACSIPKDVLAQMR